MESLSSNGVEATTALTADTPSRCNGNSGSTGFRAALNKLSFAGFNGWTNKQNTDSKAEAELAEYLDSNDTCLNVGDTTAPAAAAVAGVNGCSSGPVTSLVICESTDEVESEQRSSATCFTPITDADSMALLATMNEANRQLEADHKLRSSMTPSPNRKAKQSPESSATGEKHVSRQNSVSSCHSSGSSQSSASSSSSHFVDGEEWTSWRAVVDDWDNASKNKSMLKALVHKGIPVHFRGIVWQLLCGSSQSSVGERYVAYLKATSPHEKQIRRDVGRTYPDHDMFKLNGGAGQESLFNIIKAYSIHDPEVGYCQGIGFIAGLLLMHMPEEDAFVMLVLIMQQYSLRNMYKPLMIQLGVSIYQFESMIKEDLADLYQHFQNQEFSVTLFASSWFLTLFLLALPLHVSCRIFDIFLLEGMPTIFRAALALLKLYEADLKILDCEGMLKFLQKDLPLSLESNYDPLFSAMVKVKYNSRKMTRLEKEFKAIKTKENGDLDKIEITRLKTENHLLRQRLAYLESEVEERPSDVTAQCLSTCYADKTKQLTRVIEEMRQREVTANTTIEELKQKLGELESINFKLSHEPDIDTETLQEQLIACKLREAEAIMLTKELERKVIELDKHYQRHVEVSNSPEAKGKTSSSKTKVQELVDELMLTKIREASLVTEMSELKQRITELETAKHINDRQVRRLAADNEQLTEKDDEWKVKEVSLQSKVKELERQISDMESLAKEQAMMARIQEAENLQSIAEMKQRIAELEVQNQELLTANQLNISHFATAEPRTIEARIASLQQEILELKVIRDQAVDDAAASQCDSNSDIDIDDDDDEFDMTRLTVDENIAEASRADIDNNFAAALSYNDHNDNGSDGDGNDDDLRRTLNINSCVQQEPSSSCDGVAICTNEVHSSVDLLSAQSSAAAAAAAENEIVVDSNCWFVANCDDDDNDDRSEQTLPYIVGGDVQQDLSSVRLNV